MGIQIDLYDLRARAKASAQRRFGVGEEEQAALLKRVSEEIPRDRLVFPDKMNFSLRCGQSTPDVLVLTYANSEVVRIHPHALRQIAKTAPIHMDFVRQLNTLPAWKIELLAHNLNTIFRNTEYLDRRKKPMRFLHRRVGDQLRAFLTSSYNRHLISAALLAPFIEACNFEGARPVEAIATDVRVSLKCFHPMPFEISAGKFICVGAEWSNSDFGVGRLTVAQCIWDPLSNTRAVLDETFSKVHLGPVLESDSDLELPEEVNKKIVEAQGDAIQATVNLMLSEQSIDKVLRGMKIAMEEEIPWERLKGQLAKILGDKDLLSVEALLRGEYEEGDLPTPGLGANGEPLISRWWASSVLSALADKSGNGEKKLDFQQASGKILSIGLGKLEGAASSKL